MSEPLRSCSYQVGVALTGSHVNSVQQQQRFAMPSSTGKARVRLI